MVEKGNIVGANDIHIIFYPDRKNRASIAPRLMLAKVKFIIIKLLKK